MSEPAGLAAFIRLSKVAYAAFLETPAGLDAARLAMLAADDIETVFALRYMPKQRGVLVCAFDQYTGPEAWCGSPVFALCNQLAKAKDSAEEDVLLISTGILNYVAEPIAFAFGLKDLGVSPIAPPNWNEPRLRELDALLRTRVFQVLDEGETKTRALTRLVDPTVRKLARSVARDALVRERNAAIAAATEAAARGQRVAPVPVGRELVFDGRVVREVDTIDGVLEGADPYTVRRLSRWVVADQRTVWWQGRVVPEALGAGFRTLGGVDYIYAKDACRVYLETHLGFQVILEADAASFADLGFGYARDRFNYFYHDQILQGVGQRATLDACGFLRGEATVIHSGFVLPLDADSFEVLAFSDATNPFMGQFRLKDRNGTYTYDSRKRLFATE
ncbi:MAG: hypothetical protein ABI548_02330 [Polyangiaceae bacterium]